LPHTRIVALTAHAMSSDADEILAAGLDHYMTKPLRKAAIVEAIEAARPEGCAPLDAGTEENGTAAAGALQAAPAATPPVGGDAGVPRLTMG